MGHLLRNFVSQRGTLLFLFFFGINSFVDSLLAAATTNSGLLGSFFSSIANSDTTSKTGTGTTTDFLNSITGQIKGFATSQLDTMQQLVPFAKFVFNLPQTIIKSLMENDFSGHKLSIMNKDALDDQKNYGIEFDFGFDGSGDINQPISFIIYNGRFYFRSVSAKFVPEKFYLKNADGSVQEVTRTDIRQYPFSTIIPTILKQFFQEDGLQAWTFIKRFMSPYPEDTCILKLILLIATAYKNSKVGQGYPRIAHIPIELSVLFSRLKKTPNIVETQKLYPVGTKSNEWDPAKIVFLEGGPVQYIEKLPTTLQDSLNQIQFPVYEGEQQEFKDMNKQSVTKAQALYGQMRSINGYDLRTKMAKEKIVPFVDSTSTISPTDAALLMYAIKIHALERLDALSAYLMSKMAFITGLSNIVSSATAIDQLGASDLDIFKKQLASINIDKLKELLNTQFNDLKDLLIKAQTSFSKRSVLSTDISFLDGQAQGLSAQIDRIVLAVTNMENAIIASNNDDFKTFYKDLIGEINNLSASKAGVINTTSTGQKISIPLIDYLKLRFFQFEQLDCKKFDGDVGYFKDDSAMDIVQGVTYATAVILRAMKDLMKAQALFNVDTQGQYMTNLQGQRELIRGKLIYQDYKEKPTVYLMNVQDNVKSLTEKISAQADSAVQQATDLGASQINDKLKQANDYFSTLNTTYLYYLRQYKFDHRDLSGSTPGTPFDASFLTQNIKTQAEIAAADTEKNANDLIDKYKLTSGSPSVRLDLMIFKKKVETLLAPISESSYTLKLQASLTDKQAMLLQYQDELKKLDTLKTTLSVKLPNTANQTTSTTTPATSTTTSTTSPTSATGSTTTPTSSATTTTPDSTTSTTSQAPATTSSAASTVTSSSSATSAASSTETSTSAATTTAAANLTTEQVAIKTQLDSVLLAIKTRNDDVAALNVAINSIKDSIDSTASKINLYKSAISELDSIINNFDLKVDNLDAALALPTMKNSLSINATVSTTQITDKSFLETVVKARELINSGKAASVIAQTTTGTDAKLLSGLKTLFASLEKGLGIAAEDSLVGQKLEDAKTQANKIVIKLISGQMDFKAFELEFLNIKDTKSGFLPMIGILCCIVLRVIYKSPVGADLEKFLIDYAEKLNSKTNQTVDTTQSTAPKQDAITAMIKDMTVSQTQAQAPTPLDEAFTKRMNGFIDFLDQAKNSDGFWQPALWSRDVLTNPKTLPISDVERMDAFWTSIKALLLTKKDELSLSADVFARFNALGYWLYELSGKLYSDATSLSQTAEIWAKKISTVSAGQGTTIDNKALDDLKAFWKLLGSTLPYLIAYYRYVREAGVATSVDDFLAREFANLAIRTSSFSQTARLYLDPILIQSFGVDSKTLIQASSSQRDAILQQNIDLYNSQIQNISAQSQNAFASISENVSNDLQSLVAQPLASLTTAQYDLNAAQKELAQTAATALSSGNLQEVLNSQDFDKYFDNLSTDGVKFVEAQADTTVSNISNTVKQLDSTALINNLVGIQPVSDTQTLQADAIP